MRSVKFWLLGLALLSLVIAPAWLFVRALQKSDEQITSQVEAALGEYEVIYDAGIRVRRPKGYEEAAVGKLIGFGDLKTKCALVAMKAPEAFDPNWDKNSPSLKKMKILGRERVSLNGLRGVLLHYEHPQPSGNPPVKRRRLDCVFGDGSGSAIVAGEYDSGQPPLVAAMLRAAILSAQRDDTPPPTAVEHQPFTLELSSKLKVADKIWRSIIMTEDGESPKTESAPFFTATNLPLLPQSPESREEFTAKMRRREQQYLEDWNVRASQDIICDGLRGYELEATAIGSHKKTPVELLYVVLYLEDQCYLVTGHCGASNSATYMPEFRAMARSLKRKDSK